MKNKKRILLMLLTNIMLFINITNLNAIINNPNSTYQTLKVLVVEIDPILNSITDTSLYPNNNGHPKVSEFFGFSTDKSIYEMKRDFEESSHGFIGVNIVKREYINEFPKYKNPLSLSNGTSAYSYDEATYLQMGRIAGTNKGNWFSMIQNPLFKQVDALGAGNYDYPYLISKLNLINRRNNNEFDMVWIFNTSPIGTYETMMVGSRPYWINGSALVYNCDNFVIAGFETARTDSAFHSVGHFAENVLRNVFGQSKDIYAQGVYNVNSKDDYNKLNLWEKFTLTSYNNNSSFSSVGNTHFPYNATYGYDYNNTRSVLTNYKEWKNYPNVNGNTFEYANNTNFLYDAINSGINSSSSETKAPDRLFQRFWFSLLPHISGVNEDGYLNNWWKYLYSLDYVTSLSDNTNITAKTGEVIKVNLTLNFYSYYTNVINEILQGANVQITNKKVADFYNGKLTAKEAGTSNVTVKYDGKSITYKITVEKAETKPEETKPEETTPETPKEENKQVETPKEEVKEKTKYTAKFISVNNEELGVQTCIEEDGKCLITTPVIETDDNHLSVGWTKDINKTDAVYKENKVYNIKENITLYALIEEKVIHSVEEVLEETPKEEEKEEIKFVEEYDPEKEEGTINKLKEYLPIVVVLVFAVVASYVTSLSSVKKKENINKIEDNNDIIEKERRN